MIRDITLGQYYSADSILHRLDPRTKILATLIFIIELFLVKGFIGFAVCGVALAVCVALSKVPISFILRGLKPIFMILAFTFFLNIFMVDGHEIFRWKFIKITTEGIYLALFRSEERR